MSLVKRAQGCRFSRYWADEKNCGATLLPSRNGVTVAAVDHAECLLRSTFLLSNNAKVNNLQGVRETASHGAGGCNSA